MDKNRDFNIRQVWQYYLLPPEEQCMPGVKNPMCNAFPRIGDKLLAAFLLQPLIFQQIVIIGAGVQVADRKASTPSAY